MCPKQFAPTTSVGQTILEQSLSKNLKAKIFNAILRISRELKSLIWCESLTQRTNNVVNLSNL
ncbi:hypothetical protein CNEO_43314 [Clostridium neonatale]|uniref:Uncharacterized protein n=1 Tax=Clostridium neonatale TaxID=137838 RepID=A0AA86MPJ4_9CLOT|nr:hypothetical protein CNEO_43314 [Clostridium neonatale]